MSGIVLRTKKRTKKEQWNITFLFKLVFMILLGVIFLFPFFVMLSKSFMNPFETVDIPIVFFPEKVLFENYYNAVTGDFLRPLLNSLLVVSLNTVFIPLSAYLTAYSFSKIKPLGSGLLFSIGMATLMIPGIICTVPLYVQYSNWGWLNTFYPLIIPSLLGGGMTNIFLMMQFLKGVPNSFREAAKIDGASEFDICFLITAPMVKPVLVYVAVQSFIGSWNNFTGPLTYINNSDLYTLPVAMYRRFYGMTAIADLKYNEQCAMCVIMMLPPLLLFIKFQDELIDGIKMGGIKG